MDFAYCIFVTAVLFLANYKKIENLIGLYDAIKKSTDNRYEHSHNLVIDLGDVLMNKEGIEQYEALKPKFEQVKRYCLNESNQNITRIAHTGESQFEPVKLKVVS
jgi:energy-converting hydrogenase A subunit M